jgi:DNA invertase Pin-like site-specific DNA recombinase
MNIGYAWVSTMEPEPRPARCRPSEKREFERMLDQLRSGDTVIVWKLDRLACSNLRLAGDDAIREASGRFHCPNRGRIPQPTPAG